MIKIIKQIERTMSQNIEYILKTLERLDPEIKDLMYSVLESGQQSACLLAMFYMCLDLKCPLDAYDGNYANELDPEVKAWMSDRDARRCNQLWTLVIIYLLFEKS